MLLCATQSLKEDAFGCCLAVGREERSILFKLRYPQRPVVVESTGEVDGLGLKRNKVKISAVVLPDKVDPRQGSILLRDSNGTFIFMLKVRPSM